MVQIIRSGKLQNESFSNFSNFRPEFCPEFCSGIFPLNFSRTFRASFRGRRETRKNSPKIPAIFQMQNSQANTQKIFTKFFWRAGKVTNNLIFSKALRVVDVRAKKFVSLRPCDRESLFDFWPSKHLGQDCRQEFWAKKFMLSCFVWRM